MSLRNPESSYLSAGTLPLSQMLNNYKYMKLYKKASYINEICEVSFFPMLSMALDSISLIRRLKNN